MIYIHSGSGAQSHYRRQLPAKFLTDHGLPTLCSDSITDEELEAKKVFVFGGIIRPGFVEIISILKKKGKKVCYEIDDDIWHVPQWNPAYPVFNKDVLEVINYVMSEVDHVIVTTPALAKIVPNPVILPNLIDLNDYNLHQRPDRDEVRLFWTGSIHHMVDLEQVVKPLDIIFKKYPHVKMYFMGDLPTQMAEFRRINYSHLGMLVPAARYNGQVNFIQSVALPQYAQTILDIEPDIALLPLDKHVFNDSKSSIKFYECSLAGAVCVASDRPPYSICPYRIGHNDTDGWVDILSQLIEDAPRRKREATINRNLVAFEYSWQSSKSTNDYLNFFGGLCS